MRCVTPPSANRRFSPGRLAAACLTGLALVAVTTSAPAFAQNILPAASAPPGVRIDPDGTVTRQEIDEKAELTDMRNRARAAQGEAKNPKVGFVSLPKAFAAARAAVDAGKPVSDELKYLGGLTRVDALLVYPETNDLVIGGQAEPVQVVDEQRAIGRRTGRPVLRLDDLVVAMRVVRDVGGGAFGCRLDPDPASPARVSAEMQRLAKATRAERVKAVQKAVGPQKVSFFGRVPEDTRFALTTIAADYELKRYGLGLARSTVPDLGNGVDNSRQAVNMWWFELAYDPILISPAGDAYGLRGPRLKVMAGNFNWDPKGSTPKAFEFAKRMSQRMEALAVAQPLIADLQNLADLTVMSALIQRDRLDQKVGWDTAWLMREGGGGTGSGGAVEAGRGSAGGYSVAKIAVPKNAEALANYTNGAIAAGGVMLTPSKTLAAKLEADEKGVLADARKAEAALRKAKPDAGPAVAQQ
jgi:hypothetical protein